MGVLFYAWHGAHMGVRNATDCTNIPHLLTQAFIIYFLLLCGLLQQYWLLNQMRDVEEDGREFLFLFCILFPTMLFLIGLGVYWIIVVV